MATEKPPPKYQILDPESGRPVALAEALNYPQDAPKLQFHVDTASPALLDASKDGQAAASKIADPVSFDKVLSILTGLMEDERSYPFLEPVDHVALGLNDYPSVVKTPMDLGTVKKRLVEDRFYDLPSSTRTFRYINGQRVLDDVLLVFDNCMKYNQDGSQIFQFAAQLKASFRTKWSREVAMLDLGAPAASSTRSQSRRQSRSRKSICVGAVVDYFITHKWDQNSQLWLVVKSDKRAGIKRRDRKIPIPEDIDTMDCVVPLHDNEVLLYRVASFSGGRSKKIVCAEADEPYQRESIIFLARFHALVRLAYELRSQAMKAAVQRITVLELIAKVSFQCIESEQFPLGVSYTDFFSDNADFFREELDNMSPGLKSTLNFAKALSNVSPRTMNVLLQSLPNSKVLRISDTRPSDEEVNQDAHRSARESLMLPPPRPLELYMNTKAVKPFPKLGKEDVVGLWLRIGASGDSERAFVVRYRPRTCKHLLRYEDGDRQVWTDLDKVRTWRVVDSPAATKPAKVVSEQHIVPLATSADLSNFEVPSHLLSGIVSVFLFFKTFRDKLDIDMPMFTFEELCTAILTKSVSEHEDGDLQNKSRTPRLLMRIHIALLEVYIRTAALEQAQLAAMDKSQGQKSGMAKRSLDDIISEWAFNQVVHTDETLSLFHANTEVWQHMNSESKTSSADGRITLSCVRDPGWRATPPEFLASLFQYYSCTLQWDPGFAPRLSGVAINLYAVYSLVHTCGGLKDVKDSDWHSIVNLLHLSYEGEDELESMIKALQAVYTRYLVDYEKHYKPRSSGRGLHPGMEFCVWPNVVRKGAPYGKPVKSSARAKNAKQAAVAKPKGTHSAFDRLVDTQRKALKDAGRNMDEAELVKLCKGLWSNMSESEKNYYETLATRSSGDGAKADDDKQSKSANGVSKETSGGVKSFAEKNLCFNALNELTWQELLIETLKRIDPLFLSKREEVVPAGAAPFQRRERRGRPRRELNVESPEEAFDVGEYDLAEEEEKETNLWASILGDGKLMKAEEETDGVKAAKKTESSIVDHAKRLVEALISHPLYAHYAEPTTRLKNFANIVKTPMDLEIVMKRLLGGYYSTSEKTFALDIFARDVDLIWTNACVFFKNTSTPYEDAVHLRGIFHERLEHLRSLHEKMEEKQMAEDLQEFKRVVMGMEEKPARAEYEKLSKKWQMRVEPVQKSYSYGDPASANLKKKFARVAMKHLFSDLRSEPFREPVDAVALGLADYHDVIKRPMDLGTVRKNLKQGFYDAPAATDLVTPRFVQDVRLVFSNCRVYNERGSEISKAATQLENSFLHLLEQHSRDTAAEDRAKLEAKKAAAKLVEKSASKLKEKTEKLATTPPQRPKSSDTMATPGSSARAPTVNRTVPNSAAASTAIQNLPASTAVGPSPLVAGSSPATTSSSAPAVKMSAPSMAQPSPGLVNASELRFVDSCVQLLDVLLSAPGVQYIGTNMNGQPVPLRDALNMLKMKLLNGGYNLHDSEVGNGFAFELRQLVMRTSGMTIPGSVPWNTLEAIRVLFEKEYHKRLGFVATSKWTFVGEEFMWLDNSSGGQHVLRRGVIKEYYGSPQYNPSQMSRPSDFDHLCCHVEGYNMLLSLNFWTQGTVRRLGPNGIGNFANFYGKNWAFMKDEDAIRQLMQNAQQPPTQNHVAQQNMPQQMQVATQPSSAPINHPAVAAPVPAAVPVPVPVPKAVETKAKASAKKPEPKAASTVPVAPVVLTPKVESDGPLEEPGDVVSGGKVPTLKTYFWDGAAINLEEKAKSEQIATLLCQHDYADIDPECKLYILEKICVAISDLYKSKLAIAKEMGLRAPRMIEDSPREELPKSPIKKRKPIPVTPPPQTTKRPRRSSSRTRTPTPPPATQSTRSGRKSTQPQRFNYHHFGKTGSTKARVVYRVGDAVEVFSKENSRWVLGEVVKASRYTYGIKVEGRQRSIPKGEAGELLRKYEADVPELPLDLGDFVVLSLGKIVTSDSRVVGAKLYHSHRYIFPAGFKSKRRYPSVKDPKEKVWYTSEIQQGSQGPVFIVTHQGGSPSFTSTATSRVWSQVLDALNDARVKAGLPKGGKLISGPTQYGFTNDKLQQCIEKLGGVNRCKKYIMMKDKESSRRGSPGKDGSDAGLSDSDADTDGDEEMEEEEVAEIIVTNTGDGYLPPKMINDTQRRKLEEDIVALEKTSLSSVLTKRAMSRYLRKPNKKAEIELLVDPNARNGVAGGNVYADPMDVDENEKKATGKLSVTYELALQSLRAITSNPAFTDLCQPIDCNQKGMEHYLKVVPEPMDFKTVLVNLEAGSYVKDGFVTQELLKLLELVISNCCVYNADGSQLQQVAIECERELNRLLEVDGTRFEIKGREFALRKLKLTELLMDLATRLLKDKRGASLRKKGEFGFQEVLRGLENGRYIPGVSKGGSQVFSTRNFQAMQSLAGFGLDVRSIFAKGLRTVDKDDASRFDDVSELEAVFEEEYAKVLGSIEVAAQRKHWLGEKIFVYDEEIEDVIVATISAIKESDNSLVFVLVDDHDRFEVDLHTKETLGGEDVDEEDVLLLGTDWVLANDLDKVVVFMQQRSLKTVGDRTLASWRDDLLTRNSRRSQKDKAAKPSSHKVVEHRRIPIAEADPMALLSRPTDREVEDRIVTFMQQERVKHLCDEHAEEEYKAVVKQPEKVVRPKPPVEVPGEKPNYSINTTLEIKISRRSLGSSLPFKFSLDRDTNRARVVSRTVDPAQDAVFGKVEGGDLLMEVNSHDAKFSRQAGLDQAVNAMVQSGSGSRELIITFRGQRDLYISRLCTLNRIPIDPNCLYEAVEAYGGFESIVENQWWQKVRVHMGLSFATSSGHQLRKAYESYFGNLTDGHSKTVGGQVNGVNPSNVEESDSDTSEAPEEVETESLKIRPLKDAVVVPRALHESGPCRLEPLGRDRHFNLYWHLNVSLQPEEMLARALLFVELSPSGLTEFKRVNPALEVSERSWLKFSSRAEIDTLLARLDKSIDVEARLWENLTERYAALVSAMRSAGTEFCELPAFVPGNELQFFKEVTQSPAATERIHLSGSPVVFGGAAFVSAVENASSAGDAASASLSREARNLLQKGDVIIRIGNHLCHAESVDKTAELLQKEIASEKFNVLVYRPKTEAFRQAQALVDASVSRATPAVMLNPMRICPAIDQAFFQVVSTLERKLWDLGSADPRILRVLKEWRWLHGWGNWQWPRWRKQWQELIKDLAKGSASTPSGCNLSKFELAVAALKTICRNFVSTMPPVHPDCYREGRYRLDYTYESLISETAQEVAAGRGLKLSQVLTGLPVEGDWLRELDRSQTYSNLSLLATWLYTESAARFSSAIYVANRSETRLLDFQRLKASIQAKLRKERLDDINAWMILFDYQEKFRQLLKAEIRVEKTVKTVLSSIVGRVAGEEVPPVNDGEDTSSVTSENSTVVERKKIRIRTPFEVFVAETKDELVKKGEPYDYRQVTSRCSSIWREMSAEKKKTYERTEREEEAEEAKKAAAAKAATAEVEEEEVKLTDKELEEIRSMADEDTRFFPKKRGPGRPRKSPFATPLPRKQVSEEDIQRRKRRRLALLQRFDVSPPKSNRRQSSVAPWKKFIGVDEIRNRYKSELVLKTGETQLIGRYDTAVEAALAHDAAARHHYPLVKAELVCNFPYKNTMQVLQGWLPDTPLYAMPVSAPRPKPRPTPRTPSVTPGTGVVRMSRDRASLPADMTCPICYKKFKSSGGLVYHMQIKVCEKRIERSDASLQALRQKNLERQMLS